jgi:SAM-dependent methyltransferase
VGDSPADDLLTEQQAYYEARAPEYDDWFYRRERYDRGPAATAQWNGELDAARRALESVDWSGRRVLELAPGTGLWTAWLLDHGAQLHVVDGSPAMLRQLTERLGDRASAVTTEVADLFSWRPTATYDGVFAGFFLSHVPRPRLGPLLDTVAGALVPGAVIGLIDSRHTEFSTAADHVLPVAGAEVSHRRLDDGREFRVVKIYWEPEELSSACTSAGFDVTASVTETFFVHAAGHRR